MLREIPLNKRGCGSGQNSGLHLLYEPGMLTDTSPNLQCSSFAGNTALLSGCLLFQTAKNLGVKPQVLQFAPPELPWPALLAYGGHAQGGALCRERSCCHTSLFSHSHWDPWGPEVMF